MGWLFVPGLGGSNSDSISSSKDTAVWLTLNQTLTQRPLSWRGWKNRPWIQLLSGTISRPSAANRGVEQWISSLLATRANRSALPARSSERRIPGISGLSSDGLLSRYLPKSSFSRMYRITSSWGLNPFFPTYSGWVTQLKQVSLVRRKLARLMNAFDSSSWPSARAEDAQSCGNHSGRSVPDSLSRAATQNWLTPRAMEPRESAPSFVKRMGDRSDDCSGSLSGQVRDKWATPQAHDQTAPRSAESRQKDVDKTGAGGRNLSEDAQNWMTPRVSRGDTTRDKGNPEAERDSLSGQAKAVAWPTPGAKASNDGESPETWLGRQAELKQKGYNGNGAGMPLAMAAQLFPTPNSRDWKGSSGERDHLGGKSLDQMVESTYSPQDQTIAKAGGGSYKSTRVLNPRFVEMLMGWPVGWTDLGAPVTGFTRYKQLWRSFLFGTPTSIDLQND